MITFDESTWNISLPPGETVIGRQYDNLIRSLVISGVPDGWDWTLLVEASGKLDIIDLEPVEGGVGVNLTAQMLSLAGFYTIQLRGTQGDLVRHTNVLQVLVPKSLSGDATWPTVPSEFTQIEQRVQALAAETETAADQAQAAAEGVAANAQAAQEAAGQAQTAQDAAQSSAQQAGTAAAAAADGAKTAADSAAAATQAAQSAGDAVRSAQASAQTATAQAQSAADAAQQAGQAKTAAETAAGSAAQSAQEAQAAAAVIPTPTKEDAGKVSAVNADGTAYELVPMSSGGETWDVLNTIELRPDVLIYYLADFLTYDKLILVNDGVYDSSRGNNIVFRMNLRDQNGVAAVYNFDLSASISLVDLHRSIEFGVKLAGNYTIWEINASYGNNANSSLNAKHADTSIYVKRLTKVDGLSYTLEFGSPLTEEQISGISTVQVFGRRR